MIRKILVPVRGDGKGENVLAHAVVLAKRFEAHIEVTHCRPRPDDLLPYGIPIPGFMRDQLATQASELAATNEKVLRGYFEAFVKKFDLVETDGANNPGTSVSWHEEMGKQVDVIKSHGRLADLIVVAQPDRDKNLGTNTLRAALFNTGTPVMMCPKREDVPTVLGEQISIAWNGSVESARAVALTIDLICRANKVTILSTGTAEPHGATAEDLVCYLAARGVTANIDTFTSSGNVGDALLERAAAIGTDLMIMGAYGDSHERETVFGGNTQAVVDRAKLPVIFVH